MRIAKIFFAFIFASCAAAPRVLPPSPPPSAPACIFDGVTLEFHAQGEIYRGPPVELDVLFDSPPIGDDAPHACRWRCPETDEGTTVSGYFFCAWKTSCKRSEVAAHVYFGPSWYVGKALTLDRDMQRCSNQVFEIVRVTPMDRS